jgi:hypothetical protein
MAGYKVLKYRVLDWPLEDTQWKIPKMSPEALLLRLVPLSER